MNRPVSFKSNWVWQMYFLLVVSVPVIVLSGGVHADTDSQAHITKFAQVTFGADRETVIEKHGSPKSERKIFRKIDEHSGTALSYQKVQLGHVVSGFFYVDSSQGLVKGLYAAAFDPEEDCMTVFRDFRKHYMEKFPEIEPDERKVNETDRPFCEAFRKGKAEWMMRWQDPVSKSEVAMYMMPESSHVLIHFDTKKLRRIMAQSEKQQTN